MANSVDPAETAHYDETAHYLPFLTLDMSTNANGFQSTIKNRMVNSVNPDEMAHYQWSHLDLHYLLRFWFWSAWLKGFSGDF